MIEPISFLNKDKNSINPLQRILYQADINQLKYKINQCIDFLNNDAKPLVSAINELTGNVNFDFPVSSINGLSGNVILDYSLSVNNKIGNISLTTNDIPNDKQYITSDNILVSSVNNQIGNVIINFPISSVNGKTGNVKLDFPVSSINGKTGIINLKISDLENDSKYIISGKIVEAVNNKIGNVILSISNLENDIKYIIEEELPLKSININNQNISYQTLTTPNKIIFIPKNISQLYNNSGFLNKINNIFSKEQKQNVINFQISE